MDSRLNMGTTWTQHDSNRNRASDKSKGVRTMNTRRGLGSLGGPGGEHGAFLKMYSPIPNEFIDRFLSVYDPEALPTDPVIDADKAAALLGTQKSSLMQTLRNSYREGLDYIVLKPRPSHTHVLLTPECFKRVCLLSRSKGAEEVRSYFLSIESLLVKYYTHMEHGIRADIKRLERVNRQKNGDAGAIYIIPASSDKDGLYTIKTSKDLNKRGPRTAARRSPSRTARAAKGKGPRRSPSSTNVSHSI